MGARDAHHHWVGHFSISFRRMILQVHFSLKRERENTLEVHMVFLSLIYNCRVLPFLFHMCFTSPLLEILALNYTDIIFPNI